MKTKILEHVRNVCGLKKLEFGCEIFLQGMEKTTRYVCEEEKKHGKVFVISTNDSSYGVIPKPSYIKVVGMPVHLEHLLFALNMYGDERYEKVSLKGNKLRIVTPTNYTETSIEYGVGINNEQYGSVVNDVWVDLEIDLSKTVEQNLEDEALCKLLVEVLNIK